MPDGIRCPRCGSGRIAAVLYGMPALSDELEAKVAAGEVVLNGCKVALGDPMHPYECRDCGLRFDDGMAAQPSAKAFFSEEDYAWIEGFTAYWDSDEFKDGPGPSDDEGLKRVCAELAEEILDGCPWGIVRVLDRHMPETYRYYRDAEFTRLMIMGLDFGVACHDGACANWLGALHYAGEVVEQDYERAKELYEIAEAAGNVQAMINLGYIYEYGRTGEPDHARAFMQYAKAAAMCDAPEALYKLGDMYSRAKVVARDLRAAYMLYEKSLENAGNIEMRAQAAIRIANLISDRANGKWDIPYDPMRALELYQLAERGLRIDIAQGQTYYRKRLLEAMEGQERMRGLLDEPFVESDSM